MSININDDVPSAKTGPAITFDQIQESYILWKETGDISTTLLPHLNTSISIRGFLYKAHTIEGMEKWILASEPNLKSCCVGNNDKIARQLIVSGTLPNEPSLFAVTLQGQLIQPLEKTFLELREAKLEHSSKAWGLSFIVVMVLLSFIYFIVRRICARR